MSAATSLRRHLEELNVPYTVLGSMTMVQMDGKTWAASDLYDGTLRLKVMQPLSPTDVIGVILGATATVHSTCDEDGAGHSECGNCGRNVGKYFAHCPWCGARFVKEELCC